jgi:hypothetical protein
MPILSPLQMAALISQHLHQQQARKMLQQQATEAVSRALGKPTHDLGGSDLQFVNACRQRMYQTKYPQKHPHPRNTFEREPREGEE